MNDASHNESTPALDLEARLTAYVLGELDATETAEIERRLADDAETRREVDAIRAATEQLASCLASETAPALTDEQRETIARGGAPADTADAADAADDDPPVVYSFVRARKLWGGLGLAAAACLAVALGWPMLQPTGTDEQFAIMDSATTETDAASAPRASAARRTDSASVVELEEQLAGRSFNQDPADVARDNRVLNAAAAPAEEKGQRAPAAGGLALVGERGDTLDAVKDVQLRSARRKKRAAPGAGLGSFSLAGGAAGGGAGGKEETLDRLEQAPAAADAPWANEAESRRRRVAGRASADADEATILGAAVAGEPVVAPRQQPEDVGRELALLRSNLEDDAERLAQVADLADGETPVPELYARYAGGDDYARLVDNDFERPSETPLSTFSIDVDTASYSNVRRFLDSGLLPPKDAVRIEELVNYFGYDYEPASGDQPFSVNVETNACPWNDANRLVRVGLRGREIDRDMRPATNLVFLIDVSGSMDDRDKLPLLKQSLHMLVEHLTADDRIAMVVYAGAAGLVLPPTYCDERETILAAIDQLKAGGSTNGGAGIELAYGTAQEAFIAGGVNRVILCTDGDFNVGVTGGDLIRLIEAKRETGVFLSVLGFGRGNLQDARMEELSNKGNGNFAYIDSLDEGRRVFVDRMAGTLVTIAKDVKIQVEFNPARVGAYRLIGYANRRMAAQDFRDDRKDAGEIGAGHTVTALYELAPPDGVAFADGEQKLRYQEREVTQEAAASDELLTVMLRYKAPDGDTATEVAYPVVDEGAGPEDASADFRFAAGVAAFGMVLRDSPHKGAASFDTVLQLAKSGETRELARRVKSDEAAPDDRAAFIALVERAKMLTEGAAASEAERE